MINVSNEFKNLIAMDNRNFLVRLDITLRDGTVLNTLDDSDLWQGGFKIHDGVTQMGQFTVGSCITNKLTVTLNNTYDKFSEYDFDGAVVEAYLGLPMKDGRIEGIPKGIFTVENPQYDGATITLECLDNMYKFDVDYRNVNTVYPATLGQIVRDICSYCKVRFQNERFENDDYEVKERPESDALTCRQILASCAQISCHYGRCDIYGGLEFKWFNREIFEKNSNLDGKFFDDGTPSYQSGDSADGGDFHDYSSGISADGGTFDDLNAFHHLYSLSAFSTSTDDVVITGVEVTEEFAETERDKKNSVLNGNEGYVLQISGNNLIQKGAAATVAGYLGERLIGMRFRPLSVQTLGDPTVEAGDVCYVTDLRQNSYRCLITNLTFVLGGFMDVSCDAESPGKNSSKQYSETTQAVVKARKNAQAQISEYDLAVQALTNLITQSFGVYKTAEEQEDGSFIYYIHEKPTLAGSDSIWKIAGNIFSVSTDGGETWNAGMDSSGNAVVNVLSAIGINCDWIHAGTLTLGGSDNQNGRLVMLDGDGNVQGRWNNGGIYTTGPITSDNPKDKYSICIDNGCCYIRGANGKITGIISYLNEGIAIDSCGGSKNCRVTLGNDGKVMIIGEESVTVGANGALNLTGNPINIGNGKSGTANFSDGSYLTFESGLLVGGRTADGTVF